MTSKCIYVVFDQNTYLKTGNLRSSLYSVVYISKDKKSLLVAKPKTHILKLSKYPNEKSASVDNYYSSANLHMEFVSRDVRMLNFICRGNDTEYVCFDEEWSPLEMEKFLGDIMDDSTYSIEIKAPVISSRDNLDIKDTIKLLERQIEEQKLRPEIEIKIPRINKLNEMTEESEKAPEMISVKTRVGRNTTAPKKYSA